jgi:TldD protein
VSAAELISGVQDGIYILGNGSWSIDHQRYNFQFGGQVFYEIKNGRLGQMLRDVAYQSNTVEFWNACDGLGGREEYFLGGAFNCGKAQPMQIAPVSHGAVPARFRKISVINTNRET